MILNIPQEIYNEFEPENVFNCLMNIDGQLYRNQASRKTSRIRIHGQDYFIKQHKGVGYIEIFKNLLRGRLPVIGAKNEWRAIELCDRLSIKTTPLVGYGASGWNVATAQSFVLTAPLENMQSLDHVFKKNMNFAKKRKIIAQLAKVVRAFHQAGMCHKDMYLCHFLLDEKTFCIYVMDLHRVTIQKKLSKRNRIKDLSALLFSSLDLGFSTRDYFYFLSLYMDLPIAVIARSVTKPRQCDRSPRHCDRSPRQCDRSPRHCEGSPRHCERSEAIQAYKPGLLRCARNDGGCARNDGDYPRNDGDLSSLLVPINNRAQALYIKESRLK